MTKMSKTLTALAAAATIAVAAIATPQPAEARGGRIAAGIIGGLAAGAIIGAVAGNGYYGYGPGYYYAPDRSITAMGLATHPSAILGRLGLALAACAGLRLGRSPQLGTNESKSPESSEIPGFFEREHEPLPSNFRHIMPASFTGAGIGIKIPLRGRPRPTPTWRETQMKKTLFAFAAAATIAAGTLAAPSTAEARCFGWGCGVGLGVLGGVVAGTALGLGDRRSSWLLRLRRLRRRPTDGLPRLLGPQADPQRRRQGCGLEPPALVLPVIVT